MGQWSCVRPFGPYLWQIIFVSAALITTIHALSSALRIDTAAGKASSVSTIASGDRPIRVDFRKPFNFNNKSIYSVWIHRDGFLSLEMPESSMYRYPLNDSVRSFSSLKHKLISVFMARVGSSATVRHRLVIRGDSVNDCRITNVMRRLEREIRVLFPADKTFRVEQMLVVNWDGLQSEKTRDEVNSFEVALVTGRRDSFVIFNYVDINWDQGRAGDPYPQAGLADRDTVYALPLNGQPSADKLESSTNVATPGMWVLKTGRLRLKGEFQNPDVKYGLELLQAIRDGLGFREGSDPCRPSVSHLKTSNVKVKMAQRRFTCDSVTCPYKCTTIKDEACCVCPEGMSGDGHQCIDLQKSKIYIRGPVRIKIGSKLYKAVLSLQSRARGEELNQGYVSFEGEKDAVSIAELLVPLFVTPLWFTAYQKDGGVNALELSGLRMRRRADVMIYGFGSFTIEQAVNGLDAQYYGRWDTNITGRLRDPGNLPGAISNINMQYMTFTYNKPGLVSTKWKTLVTAESKPYTVEWTEEINYFPSCPMKPVPKTLSVFMEGMYAMRTRDKQVYYMGFSSVKGESSETDPCAYPKVKCPGEQEMCVKTGARSHECRCKSGFEMRSQKCQDIDECATGRHDCDVNARCENQAPGYQCRCNRYYRGNGKRCERIDAICSRCSRDGECQRKSEEEFVCRCREGFEGDGFTCKRKVVDPCAKCVPLADCINGECSCKSGLLKFGNKCYDCAAKDGPKCHTDAECVFDTNSFFYRCKCRPNFIGNGTHCTPTVAPVCKNCDRNAECVDNRLCRCRPTHIGNGTHCVPKIASICQRCDRNAECVDNRFCRCRSSHIGNGTHCIERVSAVCRRCDRNAECVDNRFCRCKQGYRDVNRDGFICIKDCTDKCDVNAICNLDGKCQCKSNFIGNGITCSFNCGLCSVHAHCDSVIGCQCKPFFEGDGQVCAVKDECFRETDCGPNGKCNTAPIPGNERVTRRVCGCQRDFERKRGLCEPISLKLLMTPTKPVVVSEGDHVTLKCAIVQGKARVSSLMWFKERSRALRRGIRTRSSRERRIKELIIYEARPEDTGRYVCSAQGTSVFNYVTVKPNPCNRQCHERAFCNEKSGQCTCLPGNRGDGVTSCLPEVCSNFPNMCDRNAACKKDKCICNKDYKMVGKKCERIPDCRILKNCHKEANCVNVQGSYNCRCRNGYTGNGITTCKKAKLGCNHLNRCVENAECKYRKLFGKYMCRCKEGYFGSGDLKCRKRYNCDKNPRPCGPSSTCEKERRYDDRSGTTITVGICKCPADHKLINGFCYKSSNLNTTIYLSQDSLIYQIPVVQTETNQPRIWYSNIVNGQSAIIIALATDCRQRRIYWSSVNLGGKVGSGPSILSVLENTGGDKKTIAKGIGQVEGLAVDWVAGNVFYTVPNNVGAYIGVANREGAYSKVIVKDNVKNPRGIAVDPSNGKVYWTDWDRSNPRIESSNMDGSERKIVIQNLRNLPNGLVYDFAQQRLCWIEADKQLQISVNSTTIKCLKPNENNPVPRQMFYENEGQPFAITYNSPTFYYTDRLRRQLQSVTNNVRSPVKSALRVTGARMYGVTVMPEKCPPANNACSRIDNKYGGCRYLCLPVANGGKRCACPDDQKRCTPTV